MKKKVEESSKLEEPTLAYGLTVSYSPLNLIIGGKDTASPSDFDLVTVARKGVSKRNLLLLAKKLYLTIE